MVIAGIRNERYRRSMDLEKDEVFIERRKVALSLRNENCTKLRVASRLQILKEIPS